MVMNERIFNIFVYFDDGLARSYGVRHHRVAGSDVEKATLLRAVAQSDCELAKRFALPRTFTPEQWRSAQRQGGVLCYFEQAFEIYRAPKEPLFCLTAVVDGVVKVDLSISGANFRGDEVSAQQGRGAVPDYLVHYMDGVQFRLPELIHDDYFKAIKALFNCGLYVSCAKLLMSCIDTLAFVEFGDMPGNFSKWLDAYVDLAALNITSEELWEFRNSVVHDQLGFAKGGCWQSLADRTVYRWSHGPTDEWRWGVKALQPSWSANKRRRRHRPMGRILQPGSRQASQLYRAL